MVAWAKAAWAHLLAKPELSLRPQRWPVPLLPDGRSLRAEPPVRIVVFGVSSDYGNGLLLQLLRLGRVPVALVTSTRLHAASGETLFAQAAAALDVPFLAFPDVNAPGAVECLRALRPDVVLVFSFDQILGPAILRLARHGCINFHPSLLPRYRGPEPLFWQVLSAERESGLSAHLMTQRIDGGPILAQVPVAIQPDDSAGSLARRIVARADGALAGVLGALASGRLVGTRPDLTRGSYHRGAPRMALDWRRPATDLERLVRAGRPDCPPYFVWSGERHEVLDCRVVPGAGAAGVVVAVTRKGPVVATSEQCLLLTRVMVERAEAITQARMPRLCIGERLPCPEDAEPSQPTRPSPLS